MKHLLKIVCVNCGLIKCQDNTSKEVWPEPWFTAGDDYRVKRDSTYYKTSEKEICPNCYNQIANKT